MEFKRVQSSPIQSPSHRGNPLIQPLISISKASTPVRTRVVNNNNGPMNSTPVNVNKIPNKVPLTGKPCFTSNQGHQNNLNGNNKENASQNARYDTRNNSQKQI